MIAIFTRGRRYHRIAHWVGIAAALPLVVLAAWATARGLAEPDFDERMEILGVAMFAPVVALIFYGLARAVGWFLLEVFD